MADDLTSNPQSIPTGIPATPPVLPDTPMPSDPVATPVQGIPAEPPMVSPPVNPQPVLPPTQPSVPSTLPVEPVGVPVEPAAAEQPVVETPPVVADQPVQEIQPSAETPQETIVQNRMEPSSDGQPSDASDTSTPDGEASGDDKKSPLEILEEILAGANAEQDLKAKEEEAKQKKEEEEKAAFEAKKQAFAQETQVKMAETQTALQEAAAVREKVEADLKAKDKDKPGELGEEFVINQLSHDTIQTTE